jgi:acyl-CoA thioester hydrolase
MGFHTGGRNAILGPMNPAIPAQHVMEIRVRYQETDGQGRLHHANFINYFEVGRVEMLRAGGCSYRDLEASGLFLVVVEVGCQYYAAARYDDLLTLRTTVAWAKGVRIRHEYEVSLEGQLLASGHTVVAATSPEGRVVRLPAWLRKAKPDA